MIKLLEENKSVNLHGLGLGNNFLDMVSPEKAQETPPKKDKFNFIKIKNIALV